MGHHIGSAAEASGGLTIPHCKEQVALVRDRSTRRHERLFARILEGQLRHLVGHGQKMLVRPLRGFIGECLAVTPTGHHNMKLCPARQHDVREDLVRSCSKAAGANEFLDCSESLGKRGGNLADGPRTQRLGGRSIQPSSQDALFGELPEVPPERRQVNIPTLHGHPVVVAPVVGRNEVGVPKPTKVVELLLLWGS